MDAVEVISFAYAGLMLAILIVFFIGCIRHRKRIRPYTRYALLLAVSVILVDVTIFSMLPDNALAAGIPFVFCMDIVAFVRFVIYSAVGMFCAASMGYSPTPLLRALLANRPHVARGMAAGALIWAPALAAGFVVYSSILFTLVPVHMSDMIRQMLEASATSAPMATEPSWLAALVMIEFALAEEIMFRLGIQNYIAKLFGLRGGRYWIAIVLTAALWSMAHINTLEPNWAKIAQVFPIGLALGALFRRYGLEACIVAHALFNLIMMFLAARLIQV